MPAWNPGAGPMQYNPGLLTSSQTAPYQGLNLLAQGNQQQLLNQQGYQQQLGLGQQQYGFQSGLQAQQLAGQMQQAQLAANTQLAGYGSQQNIANIQAGASEFPAQLQQQRFNTVWPFLSGALGNALGGGMPNFFGGGSGGPGGGGAGGGTGGYGQAGAGQPQGGQLTQGPNRPTHGPMQGGGAGNSLIAPGGNNLSWSLNPNAFKNLPQGANAGYGQGGLETVGGNSTPGSLPVNSQVLAGMLQAQSRGQNPFGGGAAGGAGAGAGAGGGAGGGAGMGRPGGAPAARGWGQGGFGQSPGAANFGGQPKISANPVYSPQQIQQAINTTRAGNDQGTQSQIRNMQNDLAGRGFGANSPLAQALGMGMQSANLSANTQAQTQLGLGAAQANAQQVLAGQTAQEQQYAARQTEAIQRAQIEQQYLSSALAALGGLI